MAQNKTPRNTATTNSARTGGATTTTLRPANAATAKTVKPTHDMVAQRAHALWVKNGCKHGQDEQNWLEAERQLKAEMSK